MTELGFGLGGVVEDMTDGQLDGRMDGWTDEWIVGHDGGNGQEGVVGQQGQVGQVRRVGTKGHDGLPAGGVLKTLIALKYGDPTLSHTP
jgi:hypothetical protein